MSKHDFPLERVIRFFELTGRNEHIAKKIHKIYRKFDDVITIAVILNVVRAQFGNGLTDNATFFRASVMPRITGVTSKHWDGFFTHCRNHQPKTLNEAIRRIDLPGLDLDTMPLKDPRFASELYDNLYSFRIDSINDRLLYEFLWTDINRLDIDVQKQIAQRVSDRTLISDLRYIGFWFGSEQNQSAQA